MTRAPFLHGPGNSVNVKRSLFQNPQTRIRDRFRSHVINIADQLCNCSVRFPILFRISVHCTAVFSAAIRFAFRLCRAALI